MVMMIIDVMMKKNKMITNPFHYHYTQDDDGYDDYFSRHEKVNIINPYEMFKNSLNISKSQ